MIPALHRLARDAELSRRGAWIGWSTSAVVHVAAVALLYATATPPDFGFEFTVPSEIEIGLTEAVEVAAPPPVAPPDPPPQDPVAGASGRGSLDAGVAPWDATVHEAGVPNDAPRRRRRDAAVDPDADPLVASTGDGESRPPVAFLPAGGQIAVRLDLDRVRASPVRSDVERLLAVIPDWQAILGESGVDPVRDLSRVLLATPDLQRSSVVVAGRLAPEAEAPDVVIGRMVAAAGGTVAWEDVDGVRSTDWPNPDATPRRVAIVGDRHFVIARGQDLPRVLAIAAARATDTERSDGAESPADALLSLPEGAAITVEVEGARNYIRRSPCTVPTRLRARLDERDDVVAVSLHGVYTSEEESAEAARCFETLRDRYAVHPAVAFLGMATVLGHLEIESEAGAAALDARTQLTYTQVRRILDYLRNALRRSAPPPASGVTPVPPPGVTPVPPPPIVPIVPVPPPPAH